jgi:hypothetical protein
MYAVRQDYAALDEARFLASRYRNAKRSLTASIDDAIDWQYECAWAAIDTLRCEKRVDWLSREDVIRIVRHHRNCIRQLRAMAGWEP